MKKKLIFGLIFLLLAFGFLEAQYHFFLRANRYWSNAGVFSTDNKIQSIGSNNTVRAAYNAGSYAEFVCASDGTADFNNMGQINFTERAIANRGEGVYLFANGLAVGNEGAPGDSQGIKMEFDWGSTPTLTGNGRMVHGLDIKMVMEESWDFTSNDRNAVIRGARIQGWSEDDVGGRVMGMYLNARAEGTSEVQGIIGGTDDGPGVIALEARTELGTSAVITTPAVVGLLVFHNGKSGSNLIGDYRAINICQPLMPTQTGTMYGIWFGDDNNTNYYPFDYAFGFSSELDADTTAHYNSGFTASGANTLTDIDGWIIVEIDGNPLYIYCFATKPT